MPTFDDHKNLAVSAVATAPSPATSGTSLVVTSGHGTRFPAVPFNATIWPSGSVPDPSNAEIVRVTALSTDTLTIVRAQEGTTARSVGVGDQIAATITDKVLTDIEGAFAWTESEVSLGSAPDARTAGKFNITTTGQTTGKPVFIQQASGPYTGKGTRADEAEMDIVRVTARVTSATNIECFWNSGTRVRGNYKFLWQVSA